MRILLLNGSPDPHDEGWERRLAGWREEREGLGDRVERRDLRDMDIRFCTGCWSCWLKTPGLCAFKDGMTGLYPEILASDVTVWAAPLVMGNVPALVKKAQDRFIPLIHPYIELDRGECHHRRRYPRNIDLGALLGKGPEDTAEDVELVMHQMERLARNARGRLVIRGVFETDAAGAAGTTGALGVPSARKKEAAHEAVGA